MYLHGVAAITAGLRSTSSYRMHDPKEAAELG